MIDDQDRQRRLFTDGCCNHCEIPMPVAAWSTALPLDLAVDWTACFDPMDLEDVYLLCPCCNSTHAHSGGLPSGD